MNLWSGIVNGWIKLKKGKEREREIRIPKEEGKKKKKIEWMNEWFGSWLSDYWFDLIGHNTTNLQSCILAYVWIYE